MNYPSPRCSLKNGIPAPNPNNLCVSGVLAEDPVSMFIVNRSLSGGDGNKATQMQLFQVKQHEKMLDMRVLVDHSIVESYGQV